MKTYTTYFYVLFHLLGCCCIPRKGGEEGKAAAP